MSKKNIGVVVLKGGFGNQIFQLIFAKCLKDMGIKIYIDKSFYTNKNNFLESNTTPRTLVLPVSLFNFEEISKIKNLKIKVIKYIVYNKYIKFLFKNKLEKYLKIFKGYDFDVKELKSINIFDGYWKNMGYLETQEDYLISTLNKNEIISKHIKKNPPQNSVMVHVRRRDFIINNWDLKIDYYIDAITYIENKLENFYFDIFTDDEIWVKNQKIFNKVNKIHVQQGSDNAETIKDFSKMFNYQNYILANSSYSIIPAFLNSKKDSIVIVPDPWYKNSDHPTLSKENWIKIKNK